MTVALERIVDVAALRALTRTTYQLFGVPLRLFSASGALLAEEGEQASLCALVNRGEAGRRACSTLVGSVKRTAASAAEPCEVACFTGAGYRIVPLSCQGEVAARLVIGPVRAEVAAPTELPSALAAADATLDRKKALALLPAMPQLEASRLAALASHLRGAIEALLHSGLRAALTSDMHVAATSESQRELGRKNAELQAARDRLQEIDGLKTTFLATVSHELRTPLTSVIGYGDMLLDGLAGELGEEQREYLSIMKTQSDQLLRLITTLLDASRLERGAVRVERSRLPIATVLQAVMRTLAPVASERGVVLTLHAPELPPIAGDADRLQQVFVNLIDNALKFSARGGRVRVSAALAAPRVEDDIGLVVLAPVERYLEVRVADEGPGIPEREKLRVFDAFYQIDGSFTRAHGGSGLGLSIVKHLVQAHGGNVQIEDNRPHGAVFVVRLLLWNDPEVE